MSAPVRSRPPMAGKRSSLPGPNGGPRRGQLNGESPHDGPHGPERGREAPGDEPPNGHVLPRLLPGLLPSVPFMPPGDLVVVDVETTGWLTDAASITEIGAVRLSLGQPMAEFSALVNPGVPIPADITALTGITDAMVAVAPTISEVLPAFLDFAGSAAMVAHNAEFDVSFLTAACEKCGIEWPRRTVIDTAVLSRMLVSSIEVTDHKLGTLSGHFGAQASPAHRALADARATTTVLAALLGRLARGPRPAPGPAVYQPAADASRVPAVRDTSPSRYDVAAAKARAPRIREAAMVTAIVLIKADVASIPETAEAIAQIDEVSEVYSVTGEFDLVAMVRVRVHEELGDVIPGTLNKIPGVTHTETHIAFRTYSRHDLDAAFSIGYPESA